jgi:hypothetical protein
MAHTIVQETRCAAIVKDKLKTWDTLKLGNQYFHSFSELTNEFGKVKDEDLKNLCTYYTIENPAPIERCEPATKKKLEKFFKKRITSLEEALERSKNNSFAAKEPYDFLEGLRANAVELKTTKKEGDLETEKTKTFTKSELQGQLLESFYYLANIKETDSIQVRTEWKELQEDLKKLAPDEAITYITGILKGDIAEKVSANSLKKYFTEGSNSSKSSPVLATTNENKKALLKLFAAFQMGKMLSPSEIEKKPSSEIDSLLKPIYTRMPGLVEDMILSYRLITRFYRSRYLKVMKNLERFMEVDKYKNLIAYPIDIMTKLVFIMFNMARYVQKDSFSAVFDVFPKNEGLLRFKLKNTNKSEYDAVLKLISTYTDWTKDQGFENTSVDETDKYSAMYQIIHMHTYNSKKPKQIKPILQLIHGSTIRFDPTIVGNRIGELKDKEGKDESKNKRLEALEKSIKEFFKEKDDTLYILYQAAPKNLLKKDTTETKIKQLGAVQCLLADITDSLEFEGAQTIPASIENPIEITPTTPNIYDKDPKQAVAIEQLKKGRREAYEKEILRNLKEKNTLADFGITTSEDIHLVQSITQMTGTLLNANYLNNKLKQF